MTGQPMPLTPDEWRLVYRALGAFVSDHETGKPDEDKDVSAANELRERLFAWWTS